VFYGLPDPAPSLYGLLFNVEQSPQQRREYGGRPQQNDLHVINSFHPQNMHRAAPALILCL
jgi:hypothetical protein